MATTVKKKTPTQLREENEKLRDLLENGARCIMCDTVKYKDKFYKNNHPLCKSGITQICKECARKIAHRVDKDGEHEPTKESSREALKWLNKPFLNSVWDASVQESENLVSGKVRSTPWLAYVKNIQMGQYNGETYDDSDVEGEGKEEDSEKTETKVDIDNEIVDYFEQNKKDTIRLLGYDPFSKESPTDQPYLYSSLIGYLDASGDVSEDRMKISSIIEIVKSFNHIEKINDIIANLMNDLKNIDKNIATIKNLEATKTNVTGSILKLAADNGISLNHSKNASKSSDSWTGHIKKLKELNLRDQEINLYDVTYSGGLQQVAELSNAAILKQIMLDENDSADMIVQQRELIQKYKKIADDSEEKARILLRENCDLKDLIKENGIAIGGDT